MIKTGLLNPAVLELVARVRHTNLLVIADRGFPFFPGVHTVDLALVDDIPTVDQVLAAILPNFVVGRAYSTHEFKARNSAERVEALVRKFAPAPVVFEPHVEFKLRVPGAIGLIRTGDTTSYGNLILESA